MFNAFVILFVFFCVYAILAVELFRDFGEGGTYPVMYAGANLSEVVFSFDVTSVTPRGYSYGFEYFGSFTRAMCTLFQVMTGDSWAEGVARPLVFGLYSNSISTGIFFVTFVLLSDTVLLNTVVCILMENFSLEEDEDDSKNAEDLLTEVDGTSLQQVAPMGAPPKSRSSPCLSPSGRSSPLHPSTKREMLAQIVAQLAPLVDVREDVQALRSAVEKLSDDIAQLKSAPL